MKPSKEGWSLIHFLVPDELKKQFKEGIRNQYGSVAEALRHLMAEYLEERKQSVTTRRNCD